MGGEFGLVEPMAVTPTAFSFSTVSVSRMIAWTSRETRAEISAGTATGAKRPCQEVAAKPGMNSESAGRSGAKGSRSGVAVASARILPAWMCGQATVMLSKVMLTWPARRSCVTWPEER